MSLVAHAYNLSSWKEEVEGYEFRASLGYMVRFFLSTSLCLHWERVPGSQHLVLGTFSFFAFNPSF